MDTGVVGRGMRLIRKVTPVRTRSKIKVGRVTVGKKMLLNSDAS
jgi:hypothetical protein